MTISAGSHSIAALGLSSNAASMAVTSMSKKGSKGAIAVNSLRSKLGSSSYSRRTLSSSWNLPDMAPLTSPVSPPSSFPSLDELDTTNMLLRQRIIFLGSQIDELTADFIISQLLFLDSEDQTREIKLFINCSGGSSTSAMGIYDAIKMCKADVSTICMGLAASVGAVLLAAGTKGKRFCTPNSRIMIHQLPAVVGGKASEMATRAKEVNFQRLKLIKILSKTTGKASERIESDTYHDKFLNPWEAKEYGLVDEVIDDGKPGLVAPVVEYFPPPKPTFSSFKFSEDWNPSLEAKLF